MLLERNGSGCRQKRSHVQPHTFVCTGLHPGLRRFPQGQYCSLVHLCVANVCCRHKRTIPMFVPESTSTLQKFTRWVLSAALRPPDLMGN